MTETTRQWRMVRRAETIAARDFRLESTSVTQPSADQLLVRTRFLSLDPYIARSMRIWSGEGAGWPEGIICGRIVGEVVGSRSAAFGEGDIVTALGRWSDLQLVEAGLAESVSPDIDPPQLVLGVLGRSGITAWVGLHLGGLAAGETVLVSAASGPVGSVVGQLARARGARAIGTAGGGEKCRYVVERLGFDACLDHRLPDLAGEIARKAPGGIDLLFENVGGPSVDAALPNMAHGGRIMLCGLVAHYNDEAPLTLTHFKTLLYRAITLRGFITAEHRPLFAPALAELQAGVASGAIVHSETLIDGLEQAPAAFLDMLRGQGIGKRLIRL